MLRGIRLFAERTKERWVRQFSTVRKNSMGGGDQCFGVAGTRSTAADHGNDLNADDEVITDEAIAAAPVYSPAPDCAALAATSASCCRIAVSMPPIYACMKRSALPAAHSSDAARLSLARWNWGIT